jgi:hypothetical protein
VYTADGAFSHLFHPILVHSRIRILLRVVSAACERRWLVRPAEFRGGRPAAPIRACRPRPPPIRGRGIAPYCMYRTARARLDSFRGTGPYHASRTPTRVRRVMSDGQRRVTPVTTRRYVTCYNPSYNRSTRPL